MTEVNGARAVMEPVEPVLNKAQAEAESWRCLQCFEAPCTKACPAGIVIPRFIRMIRSRNWLGAAEVVRSQNPLAHSCGLACPDEQLCASRCTRARLDRPIMIRRLHRMVTELEEAAGPRQPVLRPAGKRHVAVVGSGPAGLACAAELRRLGIRVTLYEKTDRLGGVLGSTIPLYRFPTRTILRDASWALGFAVRELAACRRTSSATGGSNPSSSRVRLLYNHEVGSAAVLARKHDAVFWATGLGERAESLKSNGMSGDKSGGGSGLGSGDRSGRGLSGGPGGGPGGGSSESSSEVSGLWPADEFLLRCRQTRYGNSVGREVAVIGGGNVAVDAAMAAVRCGEAQVKRARGAAAGKKPTVHLLYRRTRAEMPAWDREVIELSRLGVVVHYLALPLSLVEEKGRVKGLRLSRATLGPPDRNGRPRPIAISGSEYVFPCDMVILATGMKPSQGGLKGHSWTRDGLLRIEPQTQCVRGNLFAGGDLTTREQTIVAAVRDGKKAAHAMAELFGGGCK